MFNLNDPGNLGYIDKDELLRYVTEYDIFRHYLPNMVMERYYSCPWRKDSIPSFSYTNRYGFLLFKDFGRDDKGNWITLVRRMEGVEYKDVFNTVAMRMNLSFAGNLKLPELKTVIAPSIERTPIELGHNVRPWNADDKEFWKPQMISKATLEHYEVSPVKTIYIGPKFVVNTPLRTYVYRERKDGILTFKYYNPSRFPLLGNDKGPKIIANNNNDSVWEGWSQMPATGDVLIWTKSRKEVMCIVENTGYASVAMQAESTVPKPQIIEELKRRFTNIFIWYDPDDAGRKFSKHLSSITGFKEIITPDDIYRTGGMKDLTEMTPAMGYNAFNWLDEQIQQLKK